MEKDSPRDKLLKASQTPYLPRQDQGSRYLDATGKQAEIAASSRALQAQDETDQNYRSLDAYIQAELPAKLVQAFEQAARNQVPGALGPFDEAVRLASRRIDSCADKLASLPWNARIIWVAVLIGMSTVSLGAALVRWTIIEDKFKEERRFELYGRQFAARMESTPPRDRQRIRTWLDGGKLQ
jgi:hypothetical protein